MKIHYTEKLEDINVSEGMHCVYYNPNSGGIYTGFKIYDDGKELTQTDITPESFGTEEEEIEPNH